MNGNFTGLGLENRSFDADNVADIHFFESGIGFFADSVACHIALNQSLKILHMAERGLAHNALGH